MRSGLAALGLALVLCTGAQAGDFSDWGAIVVAGDYHAHDGSEAEVFDNARRDVSARLQAMGFKKENVLQFSVRPERYVPLPLHSDTQTIANALWDLSNRTSAGCLVYMTSHGSPGGIEIGDTMFAPKAVANMVSNACGERPTVVIVSSCFSGVFVPALAAPNRLILTAARPDRASFGCGQALQYTFFDECVLKSFPASHDFPGLAALTQGCVAAREKKENMAPASEPQLSVGATAALPRW
jgi:Peptidase C13 family